MADKIFFNALKRMNTALRNSKAIGQLRFNSWLTIQVPFIVSHNHRTVSQKQWKKNGDACNLLICLKQKNYQISVLYINMIIDHTSR